MESIDYKCKICNKHYKTYQTLWKHNKKFHINNIIESLQKSEEDCIKSEKSPKNNAIDKKIYDCRFCNKKYNNKNSRWSHEQKCKNIIKETNELNKLKESKEIKKLELELKKQEATILRLKLKLEKSNKIDNITLNKLNKMLIERNNKIKIEYIFF